MNIKKGDRITFISTTRWGGRQTATRVVNGFNREQPTVRFGGWREFVVHPSEIIEAETPQGSVYFHHDIETVRA